VVMWLGELITQRGIGQGMSVLIFTNVVATMPSGGEAIKDQAGWLKFAIVLAVSIVLLVCIVFIEQGQRRIPVTFAKRVVGRRMYGGQSTYIPMKVNTGGVVPIIFANSVLYFPLLISNVLPSHGWGLSVQTWINTNLAQPNNLTYIAIYGVLIMGFAYFYAALTFDPHQQADIIRKQGATCRASGQGHRPSATCRRSSTGSPFPEQCGSPPSRCCPPCCCRCSGCRTTPSPAPRC
jgi:preprotein translocase subunit SecY